MHMHNYVVEALLNYFTSSNFYITFQDRIYITVLYWLWPYITCFLNCSIDQPSHSSNTQSHFILHRQQHDIQWTLHDFKAAVRSDAPNVSSHEIDHIISGNGLCDIHWIAFNTSTPSVVKDHSTRSFQHSSFIPCK